MSVQFRTINLTEVPLLEPLYLELARHHNEVSSHFRDSYPSVSVEGQIRECAEDVASGKSFVAVAEHDGGIVAFCKVDIVGDRGYLEELVVKPDYRGQGIGSKLMDWADGVFLEHGVRQVELLVVVGNEGARRFYERRGFLPSVLEMKRVQPTVR